jgi:dCMP deaminase
MTKGDRHKTQGDDVFMQLAFEVRRLSDDPKAKQVPNSGVGAVLVSRNRIIAQSANVVPPALKAHIEQRLPIQDTERYYFIEHAERAAVYAAVCAGESLLGATIYSTWFPCSDCARTLVWFGVRRVVTAGGLTGEHRWLESQRAALKILRGSGVKVRVLAKLSLQQTY